MRAGHALGAMVLAGASVPAPALELPPAPPPHRPDRAYCAMTALVEALERGDRAALPAGLIIYSDRLGEVEPDEVDSFFGEFAATGDANRSQKLRLTHFGLLEAGDVNPLYVMTVKRGGGNGAHWSAWLVQFQSDAIRMIRRADELWSFALGKHFFVTRNCAGASTDG